MTTPNPINTQDHVGTNVETSSKIHSNPIYSNLWIICIFQKFVLHGEDDMYSPLSGISWQIMNKLASLENIYSYILYNHDSWVAKKISLQNGRSFSMSVP